MHTKNIILIGAMGAGKSTIGKKLANKIGAQFYDSDKIIEDRTGVDISTIFEYEGENGFREREEKIIKELCLLKKIVLATGGGAILSEINRNLLTENGVIFYLKASADTLFSRTKNDSNRPLLKSTDRIQTIHNLLKQREPLYEDIANYILETDRHTTNWAVKQMLKLLDYDRN